MHTVLKRKLFTVSFPPRILCTLEEHLKIALLNLRGSLPLSFLVFLLQTFKSFLSFASSQAAVESSWTEAEEIGELQTPGTCQELDMIWTCEPF